MNRIIDKFWDWALGDAVRNQEPYYEEADLEWVRGVLPLLIVRSSIHYGGDEAIEYHRPKLGPDWEKFKATNMAQCYTLVRKLPRHTDTLDPEGTSAAYRMLQDWDPEFRKIKIFGKLYHGDSVELPKELYDLEYLESWLFVNVMARYSRVNVDLAEEALPILYETRYYAYYLMIFEQGKTLGDVRADRLKNQELEAARNVPDWIMPLEFQVPLL
ncbi:hypothetical protein NW768_002576 [Fusarium equiseti]|uniref:Uncharacterized protein n=1 Tax=Fusarium equiseti TaxID=61235 RepID=A0ABQ8RNS4_FUSEQ|nr:hypothetical protein NW768_002576 [Fusarium equiseti]